MLRKEVESSNLAVVGYEPSDHHLEVEFKNGTRYAYFDVALEEFEELLKAESHGKYFCAHIRGHYKYKKLSDILPLNPA